MENNIVKAIEENLIEVFQVCSNQLKITPAILEKSAGISLQVDNFYSSNPKDDSTKFIYNKELLKSLVKSLELYNKVASSSQNSHVELESCRKYCEHNIKKTEQLTSLVKKLNVLLESNKHMREEFKAYDWSNAENLDEE